MIKKIVYGVIAIAIVIASIVLLKSNKKSTENRVYQYDKKVPVSVGAIKIEPVFLNSEKVFSGKFEPEKETKISADIQGRINAVYFELGSQVRKGQPLIQLDNSLLKLQLKSIDVQIEGLEADVKRFTVLANADAIQKLQLEKAELGLKSALIQRESILEQIEKTTIKAPFQGIVTAKLTEEGSYAAPGIPLLQITDISYLKFTVNVSENELHYFELKSESNVVADVFPELLLTGKAPVIGSQANMANSFPVQFSVKNTSDLLIKSGMFGTVNLKSGDDVPKIIIPASSVSGSTLHPKVFIVVNGKAIQKEIIIAERFENKVVVESGISEGDLLVTSGFVNLSDGANVNLK